MSRLLKTGRSGASSRCTPDAGAEEAAP